MHCNLKAVRRRASSRAGVDHPESPDEEGLTGAKGLHCGVKGPHMVVKSVVPYM